MLTTSAPPANPISLDISLVPFFHFVAVTRLTLLTGKPDNFRSVASWLTVPILGELPLVEGVSAASDSGKPFVLTSLSATKENDKGGGPRWKSGMAEIAEKVDTALFGHAEKQDDVFSATLE